jgi:hypothetical protein
MNTAVKHNLQKQDKKPYWERRRKAKETIKGVMWGLQREMNHEA